MNSDSEKLILENQIAIMNALAKSTDNVGYTAFETLRTQMARSAKRVAAIVIPPLEDEALLERMVALQDEAAKLRTEWEAKHGKQWGTI
jgi:hypothetical protein